MADTRQALTDKIVLNLPYAEDGQYGCETPTCPASSCSSARALWPKANSGAIAFANSLFS
jgi:hypothetical protein